MLFVALPIGIGLWLAIVPHWKSRRLIAALDEPLPTGRCVACESPELTVLAPRVERCRRCGFVSGEGVADFQRQQRRTRLARLKPAERRNFALSNLREARSQLLSASSSLDAAVSESFVDLAGLAPDRGEEKQTLLIAALRQMQAAHQLAGEAAEAVGTDSPVLTPASAERDPLALAFDTAFLSDGLLVDAEAHSQLSAARAQLEGMREAVDRLLARLSPRT